MLEDVLRAPLPTRVDGVSERVRALEDPLPAETEAHVRRRP